MRITIQEILEVLSNNRKGKRCKQEVFPRLRCSFQLRNSREKVRNEEIAMSNNWYGTYECGSCHEIFEVDVSDSSKIYQGNVAEDASIACPACKNRVSLGESYQKLAV